MPHPDHHRTTNTLLHALSEDDFRLLAPHLTRVELARKQVLVARDEPIEHVYFPESGIASIVSVFARSGRTEIGIFGREGVSATCLLLGADRSPHETFIQVDGSSALRIDADRYLEAVQQSNSLQAVLLRYVNTVLLQGAQSTTSNAHDSVETRLARLLLMCHDRMDGDEIHLTHEFMSMMISADRSGVTVILHMLEGNRLIRSTRGLVTIRDREKLEELAGDSYGVPELEYRRLIGPLGKTIAKPVGGELPEAA